ncbi:MAG: hypothetical protein PVG14_07130 [Anaerolineales bacterium]|jgi:hypothetical protein
MLRKFLLIITIQVLIIILVSCQSSDVGFKATVKGKSERGASSSPTAEVMPHQSRPMNQARLEAISFAYDPSLAAEVGAQTIPAYSDDSGFMYNNAPTHIRVDFIDPYTLQLPFASIQSAPAPWLSYQYPAPSQLQPQVFIYPVEEYESINRLAPERIESLNNLIASNIMPGDTVLPVLPTFNSAQDVHTQIKHLDFQNGSGIRFLARYTQEAIPLFNPNLFYTFQGLTEDGQYYVSVFFPLYISILPDAIQVDDWNAFNSQYQAYLTDNIRQVEELDSDDFEPNLDLLDELVRSMLVTPANFLKLPNQSQIPIAETNAHYASIEWGGLHLGSNPTRLWVIQRDNFRMGNP